MKYLILFLLFCSSAFSQGRISGALSSTATTITFQSGGLAAVTPAGGYPFYLDVYSQDKTQHETILATSLASTDVANVTRGQKGTPALRFADNDYADLWNSPVYANGAIIATTQIQTTTSVLPAASFPALIGDVSTPSGSLTTTIGAGKITNAMHAANSIDLTTKVTGVLPVANGGSMTGITAMSATTGTITVPMTSAFYTVTPTGAMTWNATAGTTTGQIVRFTITTSGTTSFTLTPGTNFKSATLATGTTSGKLFKMMFSWDGTNWQEESRTVAQ